MGILYNPQIVLASHCLYLVIMRLTKVQKTRFGLHFLLGVNCLILTRYLENIFEISLSFECRNMRTHQERTTQQERKNGARKQELNKNAARTQERSKNATQVITCS